MWPLVLLLLQLAPTGALPRSSPSVAALPERTPIEPLRETDPALLHFVTVTPAMIKRCPTPGVICIASPDHFAELIDARYGKMALVARGPRMNDGSFLDLGSRPWTLDLVMGFAPRNLRGTVVLLVYDLADEAAIRNRETVHLWTLELDPFAHLAARLVLNPQGVGFRRGHSYLLRAVQLLGSRERILAQGKVRLE